MIIKKSLYRANKIIDLFIKIARINSGDSFSLTEDEKNGRKLF